MANIGVVVLIDAKISSSYTVWCLEPVAGTPVIRRLFDRLRQSFAGAEFEFHVILMDDVLPARLEAALQGTGIALFQTTVLSRLAGLADFLQKHEDLKTLLLCPEKAIFPDCRLTRAMLERHCAVKAEATSAPNYPVGLVPEIFESAAILRLARLGLPHDVASDILMAMNKSNALFPDDPDTRFKTYLFAPDSEKDPPLSKLPARLLIEDFQSLRAAEAVIACPRSLDGSGAAEQFKLEWLRGAAVPPPVSVAKAVDGRIPILYSTLFTAFSGAEECFYDLVAQLDRRRFYPVAVLPARGVLADKLIEAGIPTEILPISFERLTPFNVMCFRKILEDLHIRLVHINADAGPALTLAAYQLGVPIVAHVRSFMGNMVDDRLHFADKIITVSKIVREDILRSNLRPEDVVAIYDGQTFDAFRPEKYDRAQLRHEAGIPEGSLVVTMIARICPQKRQKFLVHALPQVIERFPRTLALFVGEAYPLDAPYMNELQLLIKEKHLEQYVRFWGFEKDIAKIHVLSDALALCTEREPFGHCILEALAMGLPAVAPEAGGGHVEILRDGENGILYDSRDPAKLAKAIHRIFSDPALSRRMAEEGRRTIQTLDIQTHVNKVTRLYDELLSKPKP